MKFLGVILITLSSTVCGMCYIADKKERIKDIESLCMMLELIRGELSFNLAPIPEIIAKLSQEIDGKAGTFVKLLSVNIAALGEKSFPIIWSESVAACSLSIGDNEYKAVDELGKVLGRYDIQLQIEYITAVIRLLTDSLTRGSAAMPEIKRTCVGVSMSAGAILSILLV